MSNNKIVKVSGIDSYYGLKAVLMLLLFWWHSPLLNPTPDLGARCCELLFLVSGFLIGYNYYNKEVPATHRSALAYVIKKIKSFYPVYVLGFVIDFLSSVISQQEHFLTWKTLGNAIVNLLMLQAWSPDKDVFFGFNGAAWFIGALMFCYYCFPIILDYIKKNRHPLILFFELVFIRISIELLAEYGYNFFGFNFHVSPVIRCIEFAIGMSTVPLFFEVKDRICFCKKKSKTLFFTLAEIFSIEIYCLLIIQMQQKWIRGYFVLLAILPVFVLALNEGVISKLLSAKPFVQFSKIQMEFFLLHQAVIHFFLRCIFKNSLFRGQTTIIFLTCLFLSIGFKYLHMKARKKTGYAFEYRFYEDGRGNS